MPSQNVIKNSIETYYFANKSNILTLNNKVNIL